MNPSFTPRSAPRPTSESEAKKPAPKKLAGKSPQQIWKPRFIKFGKRLFRQLTRIWTWTVTYVHKLSRAQRLQHAAVLLCLIAGLFFIDQIFSRPHATGKNVPEKTATVTASTAELPKETPTFATVLPSGKSSEDIGGWTRISPSDRNPVYAYPDTLSNVPITVSEQPIPDDFKSDLAGSVQKLSDGYSAGRTFDVDGITVHIGQSAKGPQSLIFTKGDLLLLIKSTSTIPDDQWTTYIKSLQ